MALILKDVLYLLGHRNCVQVQVALDLNIHAVCVQVAERHGGKAESWSYLNICINIRMARSKFGNSMVNLVFGGHQHTLSHLMGTSFFLDPQNIKFTFVICYLC